jgi:hypothetical protein
VGSGLCYPRVAQIQQGDDRGPFERSLVHDLSTGSSDTDPTGDRVAGRGRRHDGWAMNRRRLAQDRFCEEEDVARGRKYVIRLWRVQRRRYPGSSGR